MSMKKKINLKKKIILAGIMAILTLSLSFCSQEFWEGFEDGWNTTAPEEWRTY